MKRLIQPKFLAVLTVMVVIVSVVGLSHQAAEAKVEQAVRRNFVAAGLLSKIQVQAERMRRFEKEMFIYAAVPENRKKYVTEFGDAHTRLLGLLNEAAAPSHKAFSDEERAEMAKWIDATGFYTNEFARIATQLDNGGGPLADGKGELSLAANKAIGPGKDRFRTLLDGAAKMREGKEQASLQISDDVKAVFRNLLLLLGGIAALVVGGMAAYVMRSPQGASSTRVRTAQGAPRPRAF